MLRQITPCLLKNGALARSAGSIASALRVTILSRNMLPIALSAVEAPKLKARLFSSNSPRFLRGSPLLMKEDDSKKPSSSPPSKKDKQKNEKDNGNDNEKANKKTEDREVDTTETKDPDQKPSSKSKNLQNISTADSDAKSKEAANGKIAKDKTPQPTSKREMVSASKKPTSPPNKTKSMSTGGSFASNTGDSTQSKIEVPAEYNKIFVLPIAQRPLFPGFYKAVVIRDIKVITMIKELLKRGEPFIGAFMLKNESSDVDFIENVDDVYNIGVFAQITSVFPSTIQEEDSLTVVLYSHRRIKLNDLTAPLPTPRENLEVADQRDKSLEKVAETDEDGTENDQNSEIKTKQSSEDVVNEILLENSFMVGEVTNILPDNTNTRSQRSKAFTSEIVSVFKEISTLNPLFRDQIASFSMSQSAGNVFDDPAKLADFSAAVSSGEPKELQDILEELIVENRLEKALVILKKELLNAQLQHKISKDVEAKIAKRQREFYLMEQLRGIKRELGLESDGKDKLIEKFKAKAATLQMPEQVTKVFDEEINKLSHLEPAASEFNVTRNYLDWITQIPWGKTSVENYNIKKTKTILDEDHYGLDDIKDRILEFVAVGKLKGAIQGKILCFVGPPGVGKTSIGKSIARSLNREFYRFSVGGLSDVAEIKGHRRTYVGAMPGKVIQSLKKTRTQNPLILIDEIDKLGHGHQGDPASALLELLDPEQNNSFLDHYMDVPVDLSSVLFVCTANVTDTIPGPLLDRMEVIRLSGYLADEKLAIAQNYLIPQSKELAGLRESHVNLSENAIMALIRNYCRESGVRNLKKHIEKVFRKSALYIVENDIAKETEPAPEPRLEVETEVEAKVEAETKAEPGAETKVEVKKDAVAGDQAAPSKIDLGSSSSNNSELFKDFFNETAAKPSSDKASQNTPVNLPMTIPGSYELIIDEKSLKKYVGPPIFTTDRLYETTIPGVVMGLAWTSLGGSALYIESIVVSQYRVSGGKDGDKESAGQHNGSLKITGHLGDVMKESSSLAYTYAQAFLRQLQPDNDFFRISKIHLHVPEGATPKDGPSAGVTMTTSLLSLALNQNLNPDVAMTGELTLTGKVLKIGGLKEKVIAAKRSGVSRVIFPFDNISDWEDLPRHIKEGVDGRPVSFYKEIIPLVGLDIQNSNSAN